MIAATRRLVLREFIKDDWPAVLAYQSDPRYLRYYPWTERNEADARAFVQQFLDWQAEEPRLKYQLAITLADGGWLVGNCGVRLGRREDVEAELGFEMAPEWWGRGYATEAARAMAGFAFGELGLHRLYATTVAENAAAQRVLEKLGMHCEGHLRQNRWMKGRWWDTLVYGLLEEEWRPEGPER